MADRTKIEWADATWNIVTGCSVVSPGCTNCYAMRLAGQRMRGTASRGGLTQPSKAGPVWTGEVRFNEAWLDQPLKWKKPRRIFVCAHGDLFHEAVPDEWIDRVFAVMALAPQHTFLVLTKRAQRMRDYIRGAVGRVTRAALKLAGNIPATAHGADAHRNWDFQPARPKWPLPNVWKGVSVEDQPRADERIPPLVDTPAAIRWISAEPLLGPIDLASLGALRPPLTGDDIAGELNEIANRRGINPYFVAFAIDRHLTPAQAQEYLYSDSKPLGASFIAWNRARWDETCAREGLHGDRCSGRVEEHLQTLATRLARPRLDWVVVGGESGPAARPMHPYWARSLRDQCAAAGMPFFFKQWGEFIPASLKPASFGLTGPFAPAGSLTGPYVDGQYLAGFGLDIEAVTLSRVGKKAAGRLLDGRKWNEVPG